MIRRQSRRLAESQVQLSEPSVPPASHSSTIKDESKREAKKVTPTSTVTATVTATKNSTAPIVGKKAVKTVKKSSKKNASTPEPSVEEEDLVINRDEASMAPFPYMVVENVPVTAEKPDYSNLTNKADLLESGSLSYSLQKSRNAWLSGDMFDKYWIRPPKGKKAAEAGVKLDAIGNLGGGHARDKMARLHEGKMIIGPHIFEVRLFTAKDELPESDDEEEDVKQEEEKEQKEQQEQEKQEQEKQEKEKQEQERQKKEQLSKPVATTDNAEPDPTDTRPSMNTVDSSKGNQNGSLAVTNSDPALQNSKVLTSLEKMLKNMERFYETVPDLREIRDKIINGTATNEEVALVNSYREKARQLPPPEGYICAEEGSSTTGTKYQAPETVSAAAVLNAQSMSSSSGNIRAPSIPSPSLHTDTTKAKPVKPIPKKYLQKILTIFEFKENPSQRFIIPKDSVLEALPNGELLISHLLVKRPELPPLPDTSSVTRRKSKASKSVRKSAAELEEEERVLAIRKEMSRPFYTPITMILTDIPRRVILTVERSVNKYRRAVRHMEKVIDEGIRTKDLSVWYYIDKADKPLQENLEEPPSPPPGLIFPTKRHYKTRKRKEEGETEDTEDGSVAKKRKKDGDNSAQSNDNPDSGAADPKSDDSEVKQEAGGLESDGNEKSGTETKELNDVTEDKPSNEVQTEPATDESATIPKSKFFDQTTETS